jgi:PKD repeat protein
MSNGYTPILNPKTTRENRILQWILLGFCAFGICAMSFFIPDEKTLVGNTTNFGSNLPTTVEPPKADFVPITVQPPRPDQKFMLKMDVQEALEKSIFNLAQLPNGAKYTIDFGDGFVKQLNGLKATHTYQKAGNYRVTLKAEFNGVFQKVQTIPVSVAEPIEIEASALAVDQ